jgi:hypothetical protein
MRPSLVAAAAAAVVSAAAPQPPFTLTFDPSSALMTSLNDGTTELVDLLLSPTQLPVLFGGPPGAMVGANATPAGPCTQQGVSSWSCPATAALPLTTTTCGGPAVLSLTYTVSLRPLASNPSYTVLEQNLTSRPANSSCPPAQFFGVVLPRALSLRQAAAAAGGLSRHVTTHLRGGTPFDAAVPTSGEASGFVAVSAGEPWEPPDKPTNAYPDWALSVPAVDEYLNGTVGAAAAVDGAAAAAAAAAGGYAPPTAPYSPLDLRLTSTVDVYYLTSINVGYAPYQSGFAFAYNCSDPNLGCYSDRPAEARSFWTVIATDGDAGLPALMAKFQGTATSHIPFPPAWTREIALTNYDYFTPVQGPNGWDADVDALSALLPAANRSSVLFCVHGYYGTIGWYALASMNGSSALVDEWTIFPNGAAYENPVTQTPVGPINGSKALVHARIQKAKAAGFRVLMYFADGLNTCTGSPLYPEQDILTTYHGYEWVGPDSTGTMKLLNPLAPSTVAFYRNYLQGLLDEYGAEIDGFVWDETFELDTSSPGVAGAFPGYAARAWMELVESLVAQTHAHPNCAGRCVFVVAPCQYEMPTQLVADGTYEDTGLDPRAASYGVLPNWGKVLWECGWASVSRGYVDGNATEGVFAAFNIPAGIGNGWGDFRGFANMTAPEQAWFIELMSRHDPTRAADFPAEAAGEGEEEERG